MSTQTDPPPKSIAPPPVPADVGIVAAMSIEVAPFLARLGNVRKYSSDRHTVIEGELGGKIVAAIVAGPGRAAARKGASLLIGGHRPSWILSAGFGGALDPSLKRDDLVIASELVSPDGERLSIDFKLGDDPASGVRSGTLATIDTIARTAVEKAELRARTGADVVDMETWAVASLCAERNVRFLPIRVISDEAGVDLPREVAAIFGKSGSYLVGSALGAIWRRPSSIKDFWSLREHAVSAADRLSRFLPGIIAQLP